MIISNNNKNYFRILDSGLSKGDCTPSALWSFSHICGGNVF